VSSGAPAARIVLESRGAERREFAIRTGEGHAVIDGSGSRTFAVRSAPGCEGEGACSFVAIPVEGGFVARRLVLRHEGEGGRFRLRGLTLLPPVNGEKVLSPLMQEGLDTVHEAGDTIVLRNPDELPRAYAAHRVHRAADGDAAREALLAGAARHGEAVVLEDPRAPEPTGAGPSTVRVERYAPRSVEIQAEMAGDGYLVLSDAHYPGWRARVDGRPVPIYIANSLFRAVYLDGGKHRVTFDFRPVALHAGLAITAITLLVSAAALIRRPRARA
jgi:hypothetical protein